MSRIWSCKIGSTAAIDLPDGADWPMRQAVERAFFELTGVTADFNFSGWGATLDEFEQKVVDSKSEPEPAA